MYARRDPVGSPNRECMDREPKAREGEVYGVRVRPTRLGWRPLALIFVAALSLRGIVLWELSRAPFFSSLIGDSTGYHDWAAGLAAGDWVGSGVFYQAPLYPYLLGILYSATGPDPLWAKLAQIVLEACSCVLLANAGTRFFDSERVGIAAGVIASLYAPAIFFTSIVQKATLGFFLSALVLDLLSRVFRDIRSPRWIGLLGFALGSLALTRENALVFILLVGIWLALSDRRVPFRRRTAWMALLLLGASIPLASVGFRNLVVGGEFALTTSQFGTNFFIGNNANAKGFYLPLRLDRGNVKYERDDAVEMAESVAGRKLSPREVSAFWTHEALDYIRTHPIDWLGLMLRKALLVWNRVEATDSEDITAYAHFSWLLGSLSRIFHFGTLVPLAAAGLWLTRSRWRELWILHAMMAAYAASLTLFFLFARYRVPLIPLTILFAAAGTQELRVLVRSHDRRAQFQTGSVVVCAAILANLPLTDTQSQLATTYKNFGTAMIDAEKFPEAVEYLGKSLSYRPDVVVTLRGMAEALADLGRFSESRHYFERILELEPEHYFALLGLGRLDLTQGREEEGVRRLERASQLVPSDSLPAYFLGLYYAGQRDTPRAIAWLRRAAEGETESQLARLDLAKLLHETGDNQGAEAQANEILERDPNEVASWMMLAQIADEKGQRARARILYLEVLQRRPANPWARERVARIELELGTPSPQTPDATSAPASGNP